MSDQEFGELKQALEGALAFERGKRGGLRITRVRASQPPKTQTIGHAPRVVRRKASPKPRRPRGPQM